MTSYIPVFRVMMFERDGEIVEPNCPFDELSANVEAQYVEPEKADEVKVVHRCCNEHAWKKQNIV